MAAEDDGTVDGLKGPRPLVALAAAMAALGTVWIGALMLLIVADVLGRNLISRPITGVAEIAGRSVVAIVFLQLPAAILGGRLTRADFLLRGLAIRAPNVRRGLEVAFALLGAIVFGAIAWSAFGPTRNAWDRSEYFGVQGVFQIPTLPFWFLVVAGAAIAALSCLSVARDHLAWREAA